MVKIQVTAEHIARGVPGNCFGCPTAMALIDAGVNDPHVSSRGIAFTADRARLVQKTPDAVIAFFQKFDAGEPVEPFSFDWEPTYMHASGAFVPLDRRTALELLLLHGTPVGDTVVLAGGEVVRRVA